MFRARLPRLLPIALVALAAGCAGERDATEKQIAELRAEISRLRAGQAALMEKIGTLELERGAPMKGDATGSAAPPRVVDRDRPDLEVVRVSPSEGDGDADGDAARPVIRAVGNERATITSKSAGAHAAPKKGAANAPAKKSGDAEIRPVVTP